MLRHAFLMLTLLTLAGAAQAGTITELDLSDCDDMGCEGATLNLMIDDQGGGMFLVKYTIDVSASTSALAGFNQVGWKAIDGATDVELTSAPGTWEDPVVSAVAANATCDKNDGMTDKWCITGFAALNGGEMVFEFKVTGGTLLPVESWALHAQYADAPGEARGHLISAHAPGDAIPEPSAALLFGVGAVLVAHRTRRR